MGLPKPLSRGGGCWDEGLPPKGGSLLFGASTKNQKSIFLGKNQTSRTKSNKSNQIKSNQKSKNQPNQIKSIKNQIKSKLNQIKKIYNPRIPELTSQRWVSLTFLPRGSRWADPTPHPSFVASKPGICKTGEGVPPTQGYQR